MSTADKLAQAMRLTAEHWLKLADQEEREPLLTSADTYRLCADLLLTEVDGQDEIEKARKAQAALPWPPHEAEKAQGADEQPFAWATYDGEGSYDLRLFVDNEDYKDEFIKRNPRYASWVIPLYERPAVPASASEVPVYVALTDEELRDALRQCPHDAVENLRVRWLYATDFARAIERTCAARWGIKLEGGQG